MFGATNTSPFGATNNATNTGTGLFGSTNNNTATSPFGASTGTQSSLFGAKPATATGGMFGSNTATTTNNAFGGTSNTGAFGSSGGFGTNTNTNSTSPFGSTFGANNNSTTNTGGGLFGQQAAKPAFGGFGATNNTATTSPFGTTTNNTSGGLFGQNNNAGNTGTGLFGANNTNTSSPFGSASSTTNAPAASSGFGGFGGTATQQQNKPAFGFGNSGTTNTTTTSPFGQSTTNTGTGLFGQTNTANTGGSGLFGNTSSQNTNTGTGLFGQNNTAGGATGTSGTGLFGQSNNNATSNTASPFGGFGAANNQQNTGATTGGLFSNAAKPAGSLFGGGATTTAPATSGLFGGSTPGATATGSFGVDGGANSAKPSLFGTAPAATAKPTTGLFGGANNPLGTRGTFGAPNDTTPRFGLAGNTSAQQQGTSLFGQAAKPSLFSQPSNASTNGGLSLSGSTGATQLNNSQLLASVDQNPYGNNPLFTSVNGQQAQSQPGTPVATPLSTTPSSNRKKQGIVSAYKLAPKPLFSPRPRHVGSGSPGNRSSIMGSSATGADDSINGDRTLGKLTRTGSNSPNAVANSVYSLHADEAILSSNAFSPHGSSVRRLIIDRKRTPNNSLLLTDGRSVADESSQLLTPGPSNTSVLPGSIASLDLSETTIPGTPSPNGALRTSVSPEKPFNRGMNNNGVANDSATTASAPAKPKPVLPDNEIVDEHGYWISPSQEKLDHMSLKELEGVKNFTVGRKGFGFVRFDVPIDLSQYSSVFKQIPGRIVIFGKKSCVIYPDTSSKPAPGSELNVKATISLEGVWIMTKDTREPVKDPNHPLYDKHLQRLKNLKFTTFVSWDKETGTWVFKIDPSAES
ncbi:FG-nucleoporin NUP116 [Sugiyamaella lignohabitans]|uniref:FG-nucleoporin NUP116 n=1 Tax=Sugiyamaella lignohabitans TaxID=796027 RepID=A0A161HFC8_9ASCO|nr:FG-nucleoporin NUP116 [Sugiyamaella lignohabitans]ANB11201.1 FG-nucleoporin NUP116 [Sugiyamaella lignohabitans]